MPDCQCDQSKKPTTFDNEKVKYDKTNPFARSVAGPRTIWLDAPLYRRLYEDGFPTTPREYTGLKRE